MRLWRMWTLLFVVVALNFGVFNTVQAGNVWGLTAYWARLNDGKLYENFLFDAESEDAYLLALALSREFYAYRDLISFELEGQVAKHFEDQNHWEFNLVAIARWLMLPWDHFIDTSLAAGAGLSYATEEPEIEAENHEEASQFLGYLLFEAAFSLPKIPQWSVVTRIHHRSGAGGLFNDVDGASNTWGIGIRYSFD